MSMDRWLIPCAASLVSTLASLWFGATFLGHRDPEDVTVKSLTVVGEDGKAIVRIDSSGMTVSGDKEGTFTRIHAGGEPQVTLARDSSVFLLLGHYKGAANNGSPLDGLFTYYEGQPRFGLMSRDIGSFFSMEADSKADSIEELFNKRSEPASCVAISAVAEKGEVSIRNQKGDWKSLAFEEPNTTSK